MALLLNTLCILFITIDFTFVLHFGYGWTGFRYDI